MSEGTLRTPQPITAQRRYPAAPLVGVGVAVFNQAGEVLLIQRGRPPRQGHWSLPGGLIDLGERLTEAAVREVREECGIEIKLGGQIAIFEPMEWDEAGRIKYHYVVIDYWASHQSGEAVASDDALTVTWVPMDQLGRLPLASETRQVVRQAYQAWLADQAQQVQ